MKKKKISKLLILFVIFFAFSILIDKSRVIVSDLEAFNSARSIALFIMYTASAICLFLIVLKYTNKPHSKAGKIISGFLFFIPVLFFTTCNSIFTLLIDKPHLETALDIQESKENYSPFGLVELRDGSIVFVGYNEVDLAVVYKQKKISDHFYIKNEVCVAARASSAIEFKVIEDEQIVCNEIEYKSQKQ